MKYHLIGIGGIGMSSLAMHLAAEGHEVYGSNSEENERVCYLRSSGIRVYIGQAEENWENPDFVVRSMAVKAGNPELEEAFSKGVPTLYRMELLKKLLDEKKSVCVTGTDGKTTTTAILSKLLIDSGIDPTVLLGGTVPTLKDGNYAHGSGPIVTELDESDGFFASFTPDYALVTNVRGDHLEHYNNSLESLFHHFEYFGTRVRNLFYNGDDPVSARLFSGKGRSFGKRGCYYSFRSRVSYGTHQTFELFIEEGSLGSFKLNLPGEHNVYNAVAALAIAIGMVADPEILRSSLESYTTVDRRFSIRGENIQSNISFIDYYAHTPDEIRSTIMAARESYPNRKVIVVFQPHRYSRLLRENGKFAASLKEADEVCVYKLYEAYEKSIYAIDETEVLRGLKIYGTPAIHAANYYEIIEWIKPKRDAAIIFMGAGDVTEASKLSVLQLC